MENKFSLEEISRIMKIYIEGGIDDNPVVALEDFLDFLECDGKAILEKTGGYST